MAHTPEIKVRLPSWQRLKAPGEEENPPGALIDTTVGRVLFNDILPKGMPYYNVPMRSGELARVISDCYQILGRRKTIDLLDRYERHGLPTKRRSVVCRLPPMT